MRVFLKGKLSVLACGSAQFILKLFVEIHLACSAAAALSGPFDIDYIRGHISLTGKCSLNIFSVSDLMTLFTTELDSNLGCQSVTFHTK